MATGVAALAINSLNVSESAVVMGSKIKTQKTL